MLLKTSTLYGPWNIIEANSKPYARVKILRTVVEGLSKELKYDPFLSQHAASDKKSKKKKKK
jgi:hypothetical protein